MGLRKIFINNFIFPTWECAAGFNNNNNNNNTDILLKFSIVPIIRFFTILLIFLCITHYCVVFSFTNLCNEILICNHKYDEVLALNS